MLLIINQLDDLKNVGKNGDNIDVDEEGGRHIILGGKLVLPACHQALNIEQQPLKYQTAAIKTTSSSYCNIKHQY